MTETCTRKEFAARMGWRSAGQVSNLIRDGLIKLTDDGKLVCVAESIAAIEAARDPSKQGVRDRHAAARGEGGQGAAPEDRADYHAARAKKEHYASLTAEADYRARIGQLMESADVHATVADAMVTLRGALETLPDVLAPQVAAMTDEQACRTTMADHIETALAECARRFEKLKGEGL
ncbi:hypothetical protein [Denitromonas halophila]|uniref:Terminase small subunit n=1 Tax=Denitromonas halophila TaxID=1629404 RepID=A0A557QLS1_9RHOO|nr:hypothetical protein [Denitromonas halophila]TVO53839.1 hypothetical protein FHP91_13660 [Denitromonas halophila]